MWTSLSLGYYPLYTDVDELESRILTIIH
jgi:hypothetical protein